MRQHPSKADIYDSVGMIALEHVLWCAREGMTPGDIFKALHETTPRWPTWARAINACVVEYNAIKKRQRMRLLARKAA